MTYAITAGTEMIQLGTHTTSALPSWVNKAASAVSHVAVNQITPVIAKYGTTMATSALNTLFPGGGTLVGVLAPIAAELVVKAVDAVANIIHSAVDHAFGDRNNEHISFVQKTWLKVSKWWSKASIKSNHDVSTSQEVIVCEPEDDQDNDRTITPYGDDHLCAGPTIEVVGTTIYGADDALTTMGHYSLDVAHPDEAD